MRDKGVAIVDADLTGRRSVALLCEAMRSLDAARGASAISRIRTDGMTVVELAHRYDAAFTLRSRRRRESARRDLSGFDAILVDAPQPFAAAVRPFVIADDARLRRGRADVVGHRGRADRSSTTCCASAFPRSGSR